MRSKYTMLDDDTFRLGLAAVRSAKQREYERLHCPLMNKTIDKQHCDDRKRNNTVVCLMCEDVMALRKKFIANLIRYRKVNDDHEKTSL